MVGHQKKFFALDPFVVFGDRRGQFFDTPSLWNALENQVEHRHEVAFAAAKAAVQVAGFAAVALQGAADEVQGVVEAVFKLGGNHVLGQGLLDLVDPLGEAQDKVTLLNVLGDIDQVFDQGHGVTSLHAGTASPFKYASSQSKHNL